MIKTKHILLFIFAALAFIITILFYQKENERSLKFAFEEIEIGTDVDLVYHLMGEPKFHGGPDEDGVYYMYYPSRFRLTMYMIYVENGRVIETEERILP